jgi:hypothetical protein
MSTTPISPNPAALGGTRWNAFEPGATVTAAEFIDGSAALLQATATTTGTPTPEILVDQIRATFALDSRESSLRLPIDAAAPGTRQIARQATVVGNGIVALAEAALARVTDDPLPLPLGPLEIRSRCDNHLWTHPVTDLLTHPVPMQLYNEWLHQVVLLRDALLPFTNWDEVRLPVSELGLRAIESAREAFLTELLIRSTRHSAVVSYARAVLTGAGADDAYGFTYPGGRVLPAVVVSGGPASAPSHLLTWSPSASDDDTDTTDFVPATSDYYDATRAPLSALDGPPEDLREARARLAVGTPTDGRATNTIVVDRGGEQADVDLGDALRAHRFAAVESWASGDAAGPPAATESDEVAANAWAVLRAPGLSWTEGGTWTIDATEADDLTILALHGSLYPENLILAVNRPQGTPATVGKVGPARIVIDVAA